MHLSRKAESNCSFMDVSITAKSDPKFTGSIIESEISFKERLILLLQAVPSLKISTLEQLASFWTTYTLAFPRPEILLLPDGTFPYTFRPSINYFVSEGLYLPFPSIGALTGIQTLCLNHIYVRELADWQGLYNRL